MKTFVYLVLFLTFISCKDVKKEVETVNDMEQIIVQNDNFQFASEEADTLNDKAINFGKKGRSKKAIELLLEALKIEPNNPIIFNNLGIANSHLKKYDKAISYFQQSLKISDSMYFAPGVNLSSTYYLIDEYQKGIDVATYVLSKSDDKYTFIPARIHKSFSHISLGQCQKARAELKIIKEYTDEIENLQYHINSLAAKIRNCIDKKL